MIVLLVIRKFSASLLSGVECSLSCAAATWKSASKMHHCPNALLMHPTVSME